MLLIQLKNLDWSNFQLYQILYGRTVFLKSLFECPTAALGHFWFTCVCIYVWGGSLKFKSMKTYYPNFSDFFLIVFVKKENSMAAAAMVNVILTKQDIKIVGGMLIGVLKLFYEPILKIHCTYLASNPPSPSL